MLPLLKIYYHCYLVIKFNKSITSPQSGQARNLTNAALAQRQVAQLSQGDSATPYVS